MSLKRIFKNTTKDKQIHDENDVDDEKQESGTQIAVDKTSLSDSQRENYEGIYPDINTLETSMALSKRTKRPIHTVIHDVNWSGIFDKTLLPKDTKWTFNPKSKNVFENGTDAWTINILSPIESAKLIELCELYGFEDCGYTKSYRSNTRLITGDKAFADALYNRIKACCPKRYKHDGTEWEICGLNERFRWCKYIKGQRFQMHCDARFIRNSLEKSFYTVNVYLNDGRKDFDGGRTCFFSQNEKTWKFDVSCAVVASSGLALMFNQWPDRIHHNGEVVKKGVKYLMRTDVMYKAYDCH